MVTHASTCQSAYDRFHENVIQNPFYRFFVDFSNFSKTAETLLINPVKDYSRENRQRSLVLLHSRRKKVSFKSWAWSVLTQFVLLKGFGPNRSVGLVWSIWTMIRQVESRFTNLGQGQFGPGSIRSYQGLFVHLRIGPFGTDPSVSFQYQQIKFF